MKLEDWECPVCGEHARWIRHHAVYIRGELFCPERFHATHSGNGHSMNAVGRSKIEALEDFLKLTGKFCTFLEA